jgi:hypothetical protein
MVISRNKRKTVEAGLGFIFMILTKIVLCKTFLKLYIESNLKNAAQVPVTQPKVAPCLGSIAALAPLDQGASDSSIALICTEQNQSNK